jgi:hypothetical protein
MRVIEAPAHAFFRHYERSVFLAGGISNCADWQSVAIQKFEKALPRHAVVLLNPRREKYDLLDKEQAKIQIEWEFDMLERSDVIFFWFPEETLCPITLFELGAQLGKRSERIRVNGDTVPVKPIIIGTHPKYKRREDVVIQTALVDSRITVHDNLDDVLKEAAKAVLNFLPQN